MSFVLWFDDLKGLPARDALQRIQSLKRIPLKELRVYDLVSSGGRPLLWGVYVFCSADGRCLYVGKTSSRKFVERIPVHLCMYEGDWMNHFAKKKCKIEKFKCLQEAVEGALTDELSLVAMERKENNAFTSELEKFLRIFCCPKYNQAKLPLKSDGLDMSAPLIEVLTSFRCA